MLDIEESEKRRAELREACILFGLDMQKVIKYQRSLLNQALVVSQIPQPMIGVIGGGSWAVCVHCHYVFTPKSNQRHICDDCQSLVGRVIKRIKMRFGG